MKSALSVTGLQKTFCKGNVCVANSVNLSVNEGEIFTILGKSGSGKTTFLRMIAGLENPDSGEICIDSTVVFNARTNEAPHKRGLSFVFQNYALLPHLSVHDNIIFGAKPSKEALETIVQITKLNEVLTKYPHEISGGQQQRVALARAILTRPKLLLLDEPLSNIDTELRTQLRGELKEMIRAFGITTLFITHDKEDAFFLSDRIAIMEGGNVLQIGTPKEIYTHPCNLYCANFLGKINTLPSFLCNDLLAKQSPAYCRYDAISLKQTASFSARIDEITFYGTYYELKLDFKKTYLFAHTFEDTYEIGDLVHFDIEKKKLLYLPS